MLGEFKIGKYYVDGYDPCSETVYEFNGCYYHGCENCFFPETFNKKLCKSHGKLNSETETRLNYIQMHVSRLVVMKDCEVNRDKLSSVSVDTPLKIRDAMYGGRTSLAILYKDCECGGKIHYVDFNSLYPSVQYENEFPIGHPEIVTGDSQIKEIILNEMKLLDRKCGFLKCDILPPKTLFPILPLKVDGKLLFSLCNKCQVVKNHEKTCDHSDVERLLRGTWCLHEIYESLENGYKLIKCQELLVYENKEAIFRNFISKFHVLKTKYSGCDEHFKKELSEMILLDYGVFIPVEEIPSRRNDAMRTCMKLILNSLWGKLCENCDKSKVYFMKDSEELARHVFNNKYDNVYFDVIDHNTARVVCRYKEGYNDRRDKSCIAVGAYVTAYSRLKLWKCLNQLPNQSVLYYDTDSIICYSSSGDELLETSKNKLGELESELENDEHIICFSSTGPKSYTFITNKNKEIIHVKGFRRNNTASNVIKPSYMYKMLDDRRMQFIIKEKQFKINSNLYITNEEIEKIFSFTFDKRMLKSNLETVPWGYV